MYEKSRGIRHFWVWSYPEGGRASPFPGPPESLGMQKGIRSSSKWDEGCIIDAGQQAKTEILEKYKLMGMRDRLTQRVLRSYFAELKLLPIPPGTVRRLLYYILANITIRLFREKWRDYIPPNPDESETGFWGAANRQGGTRQRSRCAFAAVP